MASAATAARPGRGSRGASGGESTSSSQSPPPTASNVSASGTTRAGCRASASIAGGSRQARHTATKAIRKTAARPNDRLSRRTAASRPAALDRRRNRHGAPSTISAGPAIASTQNWSDSANT